jgi:quercetin dioxygenase-like cupin family protein
MDFVAAGSACQSSPLLKNGFIIKNDQLECIVDKVWGHEEWIINNPAYCGKRLVFKAGYQCSMHHHKVKQETFYIQSGRVVLETEHNNDYKIRILSPGDTAHIIPLMWHRLSAIDNAEVFEFSTFHREDDSYRRSDSGKADFNSMGLIL